MSEAIVSIAIFVGVILGVLVLLISIFVLSRTSVNETKAAYLLQEGFEAVRNIRDSSWDNISLLDENLNYYLVYDDVTKTWSLADSGSEVDGFTRIVKVSNALREDINSNGQLDTSDPINPNGTLVDEETKRIVITISWKDKSNLQRHYTATTYLTNWH